MLVLKVRMAMLRAFCGLRKKKTEGSKRLPWVVVLGLLDYLFPALDEVKVFLDWLSTVGSQTFAEFDFVDGCFLEVNHLALAFGEVE